MPPFCKRPVPSLESYYPREDLLLYYLILKKNKTNNNNKNKQSRTNNNNSKNNNNNNNHKKKKKGTWQSLLKTRPFRQLRILVQELHFIVRKNAWLKIWESVFHLWKCHKIHIEQHASVVSINLVECNTSAVADRGGRGVRGVRAPRSPIPFRPDWKNKKNKIIWIAWNWNSYHRRILYLTG